MDDIPPSYTTATSTDYWSLIASFVDSRDLCAAALVSKRWNDIFMPRLWGNPASHFSTQNDVVYVALVRFKRTLAWARLSTRELTHTVHLPPAHAEIYGGPRADWLRELLERLPRLQSLILKGLPFFDHGALITLRYASQARSPSQNSPSPSRIPTYNLRLLDASYCINTTSPGLAEAFKHFSALTYLDISGTYPAKDQTVLASLKYMPQLQILKARSLSLKDEDIDVLSDAINCAIRSLDLRDNMLTDHSVRLLLDRCFKGSKEAARLQRQMAATIIGDWPSALGPLGGAELLEVFKSNAQDDYVRQCLTRGFVSYLGFEHACGTGITHLYISGNRLTVEGVSGLLRSKRLHALDVGTVAASVKPPPLAVRDGQLYTVVLPDVEKLIPVLHSHAQDLVYLRINHGVVTKDAPSVNSKLSELEDTSGILLPPHLIELDTVEQQIHELPHDYVQEMPAENVVIAELEGSPVPPSPQPRHSADETLTDRERQQALEARRGSAFAPEVVKDQMPTLNATGTLQSPSVPTLGSVVSPISQNGSGTINDTISNIISPIPSPLAASFSPTQHSPAFSGTTGDHLSVPSPLPTTPNPISAPNNRKRTYSAVLNDHEAQFNFRLYQPHSLLPAMLPQLQTLILTDLPAKSPTNNISQHLIQFISDCASETRWSHLQASVGYALPPGRDRAKLEAHYARSLFALRRLVLEVAAESKKGNAWRARGNYIPTMSSVEDPDCEAFWSAAKNDFSFFGDEECGLPDSDSGTYVPLSALMEKMPAVPTGAEWVPVAEAGSPALGPQGLPWAAGRPGTVGARQYGGQAEMVDVLAEVSRFRKMKRFLRESAVAAGRGDEFVEGFWNGEIVVVWPRE